MLTVRLVDRAKGCWIIVKDTDARHFELRNISVARQHIVCKPSLCFVVALSFHTLQDLKVESPRINKKQMLKARSCNNDSLSAGR